MGAACGGGLKADVGLKADLPLMALAKTLGGGGGFAAFTVNGAAAGLAVLGASLPLCCDCLQLRHTDGDAASMACAVVSGGRVDWRRNES